MMDRMIEIPLMPGTTEGTIQWRAERLQVVNWGGFHGPHEVHFAAGSTLISGESGTGKSTLMDAYIALMMPHNVPFNGASNDATIGRARGEDQRNLVTYLRGKRDDARAGDDVTDRVLRGDGAPTWGAVGMTFVDENGRRFTAFRAFHVPVAARAGSQLTVQRCTLDGDLDLADLAAVADARFDTRTLRERFPGLQRWDSDAKFIDVLCARLGIGAGGDGVKALRLLARIQAGYKVTSVDGLYKQMVLETPRTFDLAAAAVEQFRSLDQSYRDLETDAEKQAILAPVEELHQKYLSSREAADRLDRYGVHRPGEADSPFLLWALRTERRLLDAAAADNAVERDRSQQAYEAAAAAVAELTVQLAELDEQQRANGGGALEALDARIAAAEDERRQVTRTAADFRARTEVLGLQCDSEQTFTDLTEAARQFVAGAEDAHQELIAERDTHVAALPRLVERRDELRAEALSLHQRAGQVPMDYHQARLQIAEACGLTPGDLPFAAELMDVDPAFVSWREAAEATLRGVGLTLLVDAADQDRIRRIIDGLHLERRIGFDGVDLAEDAPAPDDDRFISGRLVFKEDSPFVHWVKRRVTASGVDHLCVDGPEQLGGSEAKVTVNGQTSRGRRGAHGRTKGQRPVLGFDNRGRLEDIAAEVAQVEEEITAVERDRRALDERISGHTVRRQAYEHVLRTSWASLDLDGAQRRVGDLRAERQALLEHSDVLTELKRRHDQVAADLEAAQEERVRSKDRVRDATAAWERIVERQDAVSDVLDPLERSGAARLSGEDEAWLTEQWTAGWPAVGLSMFQDALNLFRKQLADELGNARDIAESKASELEQVFARFQDKWPDVNRGTSVEAYPEYASIYQGILHHGLPERRQSFLRQFQRWSGNDLKLLNDAYEHS
ncbi:MAG TPA: ATP-binding protein, partial [Citricoccus sp.]